MSYRSSAPPLAAFAPPAWRVAVALGAALLLQSTVLPLLAVRGATVSFVLLLVLWFAMRAGTMRGALFGMIAGACEDALSGGTGAAWTFATMAIGAAAGRAATTFLADSLWTIAPLVALLTIARFGLFLFVLGVENGPTPSAMQHWHALVLQSVLNAAVTSAALTFLPSLRRFRAVHR